jgi:hypothetical protein
MVHISISILGLINQQISLGGHHLVHGGAGLATWTYWGQSGDVLEISVPVFFKIRGLISIFSDFP